MSAMEKKEIAVVGGGSWATAIAKILLRNHNRLHWWVREPEICESLRTEGRNSLYLQSVEFEPQCLHVSNDIHEVLAAVQTVVLVVPAVHLQSALQGVSKEELQGKTLCSAVKGIIPEHGQVVCEYLRDTFGVDEADMAVISGPSHAEEIALNRLTYLTAASVSEQTASYIARCFACDYVRTRCSRDIYGIEYATVMKNVYALSVGIAKGLGYGDNFVAVLVSNALDEMKHLLEAISPEERNILTAPYAGDLLVTSYSQFSRNRTFGNMIGQGYSAQSAILEMKMVPEGYYAAGNMQPIQQKWKISMPIFEIVHDILYGGASPRPSFKKLENLFK